MVFFDTCIWVELFCTETSHKNSGETSQAERATSLFKNIISGGESIISCNEQLIELITFIQKSKIKEYSKKAKENNCKGYGNIKEFRNNAKEEFLETQAVCKNTIDDIKRFCKIESISVDITNILDYMHLADINDCIYYDYCTKNNITFYTFDADLANLEETELVKII